MNFAKNGNVHITFLITFGKDYSGVPGRLSLLENDFFTNRPKKYVRVDPIWSDPRQRPKFRDLVRPTPKTEIQRSGKSDGLRGRDKGRVNK